MYISSEFVYNNHRDIHPDSLKMRLYLPIKYLIHGLYEGSRSNSYL